MSNENEKEITNLELLESINRGFSKIEEKMATKIDLESFKLETNIHFNNIETDLKSVKRDLSELQDKVDDIHDTVMSYDKRIEVLEEKVFA